MDGLYFGFIVCEYFERTLTTNLYLFEASVVAKSVSDSNWSLEPDFKVLIWSMKERSQLLPSSLETIGGRAPPAIAGGGPCLSVIGGFVCVNVLRRSSRAAINNNF
jgi:hypothetical protein